jgi:predicted acylesterase/phospholipase RssA
MPFSTLRGDANLIVCPNIDSANISYNLLKATAGNNVAIGPILLGVAKPVNILTSSATVRRIVNMTALTVLEANTLRQLRCRWVELAARLHNARMIEGHRDRVLLRTTPAGLILTGGGARAAYQVGVLKGIAAVLRDTRRGLDPGIAQGHNPFQILVGTSAGAINAAALACRADNFQESVALLVEVWENFHAEQVYRSDVLGVVRSGARWLMLLSLGWMVRRSLRLRPRSLLDSSPLAALLAKMIDIERLQRSLERGHLRALAVSASSYTSGRHVTFYQSLTNHEIAPRLQRVHVHGPIGLPHLLASAAIPFVFPPCR